MNDNRTLLPDLLHWSGCNAAAMVAVALATAAGLPLWLLSLSGLLSFSSLLYLCRHRWTPAGRLGLANAVSLLRLCGACVLPWLTPGQIVYWGLILIVMDGVDGWIARRTGLAGEFGEFLDKEIDAFFMLMLCLLVYHRLEGFGPWILLPGLLRYLFVLFIKVARPPELKEQRSATNRWICVLMILTLLFPFATYPDYPNYCRALLILMTLVLCYSFAVSLYLMYRAPRRREQT